ncbi:MAG: hypothetical protein CAK90_02560 [Spartobacteria bacterium AMD-G4]|nr:MAG: hypothetical protein CAK90_02560 [Spartobacteria bacterium AMD-G4]
MRGKHQDHGEPFDKMKPIQWRRSKIGQYLRHLPRAKHIRGTWIHRIFGDRLFANELWHPTGQKFALGMAIGAFFALMPIPVQMIAAALSAFFLRANIPAAIAGTWISNPLSFPFCVYFQYRLGCILTGREPIRFKDPELLASLSSAPMPFLVGIIPAALLLAVVTYPVTLVLWEWVTKSVHAAREHRLALAAAKKSAAIKNQPPL